MNLPNKLTMLRVLMIPVFMVFATNLNWKYSYFIAGTIFAIASFTDFLDGFIARKNHLVTDFGKFADPLADKLLTTIAFIYMLVDGVCSPIVLAIILTREFAVSGVRMIAAGSPSGKVIAANMWGKVKTALQMLTIVFYYFGCGIENSLGRSAANSAYTSQIIAYVLCWIIAAVTAISGVQYIWNNRQFINTAK